MCVWDTSMYKLLDVVKDVNWIRCKLLGLTEGLCFYDFNIYNPQDVNKKSNLWSVLGQMLLSLQNEKVCLIGDFNCIRDESKKANCILQEK